MLKFEEDGRVVNEAQTVGSWKKMGDKHVLFDLSGNEVSERTRLRDLRRAAKKLTAQKPSEPKPVKKSRQVRRAMERRQAKANRSARKRSYANEPGGMAAIR